MSRIVSAVMIVGIAGGGILLATGYRWLGGGFIIGAVLVGEIFRRNLNTVDLADLAGTGSVDHGSPVTDTSDTYSHHSDAGSDGGSSGD